MNFKNWGNFLLLVVVIVFVSGCAQTGTNSCGLFSIDGELTVTKKPSTGTGRICQMEMTYTSTDKGWATVKPKMQAIYYDVDGNTIAETAKTFGNINTGRSQTITDFVVCNNQSIRKMHIQEAVNFNTCDKMGV